MLAIGSERYTPYAQTKQPAELLTIANRILGTGQLSLAKYLFITADDTQQLSVHEVPAFFMYMLERINLQRDLHFYTQTSIDTLDYSGDGLNTGSKIVLAAYGPKLRELNHELPSLFSNLQGIKNVKMCMPGIVALQMNAFQNYNHAISEMDILNKQLENSIDELNSIPLIVVCDDADFLSEKFNNFIWTTFTRSNPAKDIYGIDASTNFKHWGCKGPLVIDARSKPHHAPVLEKDPQVEKNIDRFFKSGSILEKWG